MSGENIGNIDPIIGPQPQPGCPKPTAGMGPIIGCPMCPAIRVEERYLIRGPHR
jgi:hypothetical protein